MAKKNTLSALSLFGILCAATLLGACHTTAGAGEDIKQTGQAIEKTANKNAP